MANIAIKLTGVSDKGVPWGVVPVEDSVPHASNYQANPATSQQSGITVPSDGRQYYWVITSLGGDAWAAFGSGSPAASIGGSNSQPCPSGLPRAFRATPGTTCAVINGA